jgi:hypothetical protein
MAKTEPAKDQAAQTPVQTPAQGGSYTLDDQTGEHTLVERTQENNRTMTNKGS